jgi:hypothetical protein
MATATILTLHLAVLIGLYELAAGLAGLTGRVDWAALLDEFGRSPALTFVTGFMAFAIGGTLILVHCLWTDLLAVIVSLIGWIALAEGLLLMVMPGPFLAFSRRLVGNQQLISLLAAGFGLVLIALGLTGRAA